MKIFKFGGASVKNAQSVRNVASIIKDNCDKKPVVAVISAMDKTTHRLEGLYHAFIENDSRKDSILDEIKAFHLDIIKELFPDKTNTIYTDTQLLFDQLKKIISAESTDNADLLYDSIVAFGELVSTKIVSAYLNSINLKNTWIDVRGIIKTDNTFKEGKVLWQETQKLVDQVLLPLMKSNNSNNIIVTQGFIASSLDGNTITLGKEGSDFTAAILSFTLNAQELTIWKDVPGVMNADPKWLSDAAKLDSISYHEAVELTFYGAKVIHPKTIKPLQNKNITLKVKSFIEPDKEGTIISASVGKSDLMPCYIIKKNQLLISISPKDYSFVDEDNLSKIFGLFAKYKVKTRLMQNSAISFSVCVDENEKIPALIKELQKDFKVLYNKKLDLITIRHYNKESVDRMTTNKKIFVIQKSRKTVRIVLESND